MTKELEENFECLFLIDVYIYKHASFSEEPPERCYLYGADESTLPALNIWIKRENNSVSQWIGALQVRRARTTPSREIVIQ